MRLALVIVMMLTAVSASAVPTAVGHPKQAGSVLDWDPVRELVPIWTQLPIVGGNSYASQYDYVYPFRAESADDFECSTAAAIVAVEWWGNYWNGDYNPPLAESFVIRFYSDVPAGVDMAYSHPGDLLYEEPCTVYSEVYDAGVAQFHYVQDLVVPFVPAPGVIYWISIQSVMLFPPQWGWTECDVAYYWNDYGVQIFDVLGYTDWTLQPVDFAFVLYKDVTSSVEKSTWGGVKAMFR